MLEPGAGLRQWYEMRYRAVSVPPEGHRHLLMLCRPIEAGRKAGYDLSSPICRELLYDPATPDMWRARSHLLLAMTNEESDQSVLYHAAMAEKIPEMIARASPDIESCQDHWNFARELFYGARKDVKANQASILKEKEDKLATAAAGSKSENLHPDPVEAESEAESSGTQRVA